MIIGLLINVLAIVAFLIFNKFNAKKVKLSIVSLLVYHGGMLFSVVSFGLLFNFFFFYWMFKLIVKLGVFIRPVKKGNIGDI